IINELNDIDEQGRNIGAVNTVLNLDGKLIGYNTDGLGYVKSLEKAYPSVKETDPNILLLGAVGSARWSYNGLKSSGYLNIDIANRTYEKAKKIKQTNLVGRTKIITLEEDESKLDQYNIIIKKTSVAM